MVNVYIYIHVYIYTYVCVFWCHSQIMINIIYIYVYMYIHPISEATAVVLTTLVLSLIEVGTSRAICWPFPVSSILWFLSFWNWHSIGPYLYQIPATLDHHQREVFQSWVTPWGLVLPQSCSWGLFIHPIPGKHRGAALWLRVCHIIFLHAPALLFPVNSFMSVKLGNI